VVVVVDVEGEGDASFFRLYCSISIALAFGGLDEIMHYGKMTASATEEFNIFMNLN
jgi:hypothetical protein